MSRLLLVSNRLPVTAKVERGQLIVTPSSGGLASALRAVGNDDRAWIGWPGELPELTPTLRRQFEWQMASHHVVPVNLSTKEIQGFYEEVSNGVLWPVAHCLLDNLPLEMNGWDAYRAVNERFADIVTEQYRDGDTIWVHDYHLMLLPELLRARLPKARIGYFHHIPFPPAEVFNVLPWRVELLRGLLGADLVGFQTASHAEAFIATARASLGLAERVGAIEFRGRTTRVGHFPISIDAQAWTALAEGLPARTELARYRDGLGEARLIVGVDRLDYTKGILRRLLAFERVLEHAPELRDQLRLVQVTVPSRENVDAYASMKQRVDELVGRINGRFGTPHHMPVHRVHGQLSTHELAGLYRAADVMMVTPLRDGMNLVAKEFVAARSDGRGVLILSEFAGAAAELSGALLVNPYDVESMALAVRRALNMPGGEQEMRMLAMRSRVDQFGVTRWSNAFLDALKTCDAPKPRGPSYAFDYVDVTDTEVDAVPI